MTRWSGVLLTHGCLTSEERPLLLSRQGTVRHTLVQYDVHTAWYNYTRRNVTKSERYNNGTVHDFSL